MRAMTIEKGAAGRYRGDVWVKGCDCNARSYAGNLSIPASAGERAGTVAFIATQAPGPKCRNCGAAWRRVKP